MPTRQQRGANWRGSIPFKALAISPGITWTIQSVGVATLTLALANVSGLLTLAGVPQFIRSDDNSAPISAILVNQETLEVTYATNLSAGFTYTLGEKDPALRSSLGSYLVAGSQVNTAPILVGLQFFSGNGSFTVGTLVSVYDDATTTNPLHLPAPTFVGEFYIVGCGPASMGATEVRDASDNLLVSLNPGGQNRFTWTGSAWAMS